MRKTLAAGLAAVTFGSAVATAALPSVADAQGWRGGYRGDWGRHGDWGHHHHDNAGPAIIAGIAGLAIGAALADSGHRRYYPSYSYGYGSAYGYGPGYYDYGYTPYSVCESRRWVWDPYIGRQVLVTSHYAC